MFPPDSPTQSQRPSSFRGLQGCNDPSFLQKLDMFLRKPHLLPALIGFLLATAASFADTPNLIEGKAFLEQNAHKDGVVTTASGLQYKILIEGNGARPGPNATVDVYYTGYLLNGKIFDSADIIRPPAVFRLDQLIKGWSEALQLMPVGSVWEIYVPSSLAYGSKGSPRIPADSTLIFEVELVGIR
jgi:FKBP-type peptidyl-prolyl cis-trans isomerase